MSIHDLSHEVKDGLTFGQWEGYLICGAKNTFITTLVECKSRVTLLGKLSGKDATSLATALSSKKSLFADSFSKKRDMISGAELASHETIAQQTEMNIYFCDPRSPWRRGTNENTNCLLRQYVPKKTIFSCHSQEHLDDAARELNQRPRKALGYVTSEEVKNLVLHCPLNPSLLPLEYSALFPHHVISLLSSYR